MSLAFLIIVLMLLSIFGFIFKRLVVITLLAITAIALYHFGVVDMLLQFVQHTLIAPFPLIK